MSGSLTVFIALNLSPNLLDYVSMYFDILSRHIQFFQDNGTGRDERGRMGCWKIKSRSEDTNEEASSNLTKWVAWEFQLFETLLQLWLTTFFVAITNGNSQEIWYPKYGKYTFCFYLLLITLFSVKYWVFLKCTNKHNITMTAKHF